MIDVFEDIRQQEQELVRGIKANLDGNERAANLAKRILSVQNAPGFSDFVTAVEDVRQHVIRQLVSSNGGTEQMWVLKGKSQALGDVLALLERTESALEQLASARKLLQDSLDMALEKAPKAR